MRKKGTFDEIIKSTPLNKKTNNLDGIEISLSPLDRAFI